MTTLNQIKTSLQDWFKNHKQVKHLFWGDVSDYNAAKDKEYVSVNIEYINSNLTDVFMNHNYRISIGDLVNPNYPEMDDEAISDAMSIAQDFFAVFELKEEFNLVLSSNIQPFTESTTDRMSGVVFRIALQVPRKPNECAVP